jgi:serine/threonine-protein kinase
VKTARATSDEITQSTTGTPAPVPIPTHDEKLGRYVLRFALATGGMATVYLAVARGASGFGRAVALKRIHPHLAAEREFVEMFLDEARIAARIRHPNVCTVEDFGEADGAHYMTMEYLAGESLSRVTRALGPMPPAVAARIIADACEGLHAAHELEGADGEPLHVVHRDISPQNLFVGYDGIVKVVDFGIAKAEHRVHETQVGMVKGKFAYMAPEQLRGEAIDRRADVWSLGVVLWELVSGRKLFRRDNQNETILAVTACHVPRLSETRRDVPAAFDEIVARALSPHRVDRFPTARAMARELGRLYAGGLAVDVPEISELMTRLFAERHEAQKGLLRSALSSPTPPSHRVYPRLEERAPPRLEDGELSRSGVVEKQSITTGTVRSALLSFFIAFLLTTILGGAYVLF